MKTHGPKLNVVASCFDCEHESSVSYAVQGDSGHDVYCTHEKALNKNPTTGYGHIGDTTWKTPAWCPLLKEATRALIQKTEEALHDSEQEAEVA